VDKKMNADERWQYLRRMQKRYKQANKKQQGDGRWGTGLQGAS